MGEETIALNRKARHEFHVEETFEAGIVLTGTEIKSVRAGQVSLREAVRAVNTDYANYSAHLFLANSYDSLRDPNLINLRYETSWYSELLKANLLVFFALFSYQGSTRSTRSTLLNWIFQ